MSVTWAEFCWMLATVKCGVYWGLLQSMQCAGCTSAGKKDGKWACTKNKAPPPQRQLARPCFSHIESKPSHHIHTSLATHVCRSYPASLTPFSCHPSALHSKQSQWVCSHCCPSRCRLSRRGSFVFSCASPPAPSYPFLTTNKPTQFLLAAITFGPWIALLVYDIILYIWRSATFDLPQIGGRARGQRQRPRAPSLKERPDGHKRSLSLLAGVLPPVDFHQVDGPAVTTPTTTSASGHKRNITATMSRPIFEFVDDDE
jgi:hypothetical protein